MGRPLNKKYFGNRNLGTTGTGDDGLGGKIVASVTVGTAGTYTTKPVITFSAPDLTSVGAVTATSSPALTLMKAVSAVIGAAGGAGAANYVVGDILTVTLSTGVSTFTVATIDVDGGVDTVTVLDGGTHTGALLTGAKATTTNSVAGAGCTLTLTYGVKSIGIVNSGSGYTNAADAAPIVTGANTGVAAVATSVLSTFSAPGNSEPAIIITAWIPTADNGSSSVVGDIVAQKGSRRMKVETAQGTGVVTLVAAVVAAGQGTIIATDVNGSTYWVTKLTSHKALLTRKTMSGSYAFATDATAQWSFAAASTGIVQIANA